MSSTSIASSTTVATKDNSGTVGALFGYGPKISIEKAAISLSLAGMAFNIVYALLALKTGVIPSRFYEVPDLLLYGLLLFGALKQLPILVELFFWVFAIDRVAVFFYQLPNDFVTTFIPPSIQRIEMKCDPHRPGPSGQSVEINFASQYILYAIILSVVVLFSAYTLWLTYKLMRKQQRTTATSTATGEKKQPSLPIHFPPKY